MAEPRDPQHNWDGVTLGGVDWENYAESVPQPRRAHGMGSIYAGHEPEDVVKDYRQINSEGDTLGGIDWGKMRPGIQAEPDNYNVSQQFLDKITPILDKMRNRPLGSRYQIYNRGFENTDFDEGSSSLYHNGDKVGSVEWMGRNSDEHGAGHVEGLHIEPKHRHMTLKLLQEAHDFTNRANIHAQAAGERLLQGPVTSDDLNNFSGPIVKKYNSSSTEYGISSWARRNDREDYYGEEDDDTRWERENEEAYHNQREEEGAPCATCEGAGESRLQAQYGRQTGWMNDNHPLPGAVAVSQDKAFREVAYNSRDAYTNGGEPVEQEFQHPNSGRLFHSKYPRTNGYTRVAPWSLGRTQREVETWVKPCESCGHLKVPGFPDHEENR
jgi:hypothetical protein